MQESAFRVRPMQPADAPAAATLIRRAFVAQSAAVDPPASALRVTPDAIAAHLAHAGGAVAEDAGRLLGSVLWERRADQLYVSRLAVDPENRRRGIGRALMAAADVAALQSGLHRLSLGTRLVLTGNRRLFIACGYQEVAHRTHPGYPAPTWVEMEKALVSCPRNSPSDFWDKQATKTMASVPKRPLSS